MTEPQRSNRLCIMHPLGVTTKVWLKAWSSAFLHTVLAPEEHRGICAAFRWKYCLFFCLFFLILNSRVPSFCLGPTLCVLSSGDSNFGFMFLHRWGEVMETCVRRQMAAYDEGNSLCHCCDQSGQSVSLWHLETAALMWLKVQSDAHQICKM